MRLFVTISIIFILINSTGVICQINSSNILDISDEYNPKENLLLNFSIMTNPIYIEDFNDLSCYIPCSIVNTPVEFNWKNLDGRD